MTITLHWWFVPALLFVAGVITAAFGDDVVSGCLVLFFRMAAAFITIGHFLLGEEQ